MTAKEPIFARTRYTYDSYSDFWKLVELSNFTTCYVDQIDLQSDNTYIVCPVNGELRPHVQHRRTLGPQTARIIWWNLERPDCPVDDSPNGVGYFKVIDEILNYVDDVWVSDRMYAALDSRMRFVPLGSHISLAGVISTTRWRQYDVTLMAAPVPRRDGVICELKQLGVTVAPNAWGANRHEILCSTPIMLNVHQHENPMPIGEPLRFALAAAYKMLVVSETVDDPYPVSVVSMPLEYLAVFVDGARHGDVGPAARELTEKNWRVMCVEQPFRHGVMEALNA